MNEPCKAFLGFSVEVTHFSVCLCVCVCTLCVCVHIVCVCVCGWVYVCLSVKGLQIVFFCV